MRLRPAPGADPDTIWIQAHRELADVLTSNALTHVTVHRAAATRERVKCRLVQPLHLTTR